MKQSDNKHSENKPSIKKFLSFGMIVIIIFFGSFLIWAFFAPLESAAIAPGKITVAGKRRTIQHLEGGIIKKIFVKDGTKIKKGQILIQLDDVESNAVYQLRRNEVFELSAIESRLVAEFKNYNEIKFSEILLNNQNKEKAKQIMASQISIFNENQKAFSENLKILQQRIQQLQEQIRGYESSEKAVEKQLALIQEEIKSVAYLEAKKLIERYRLLALQREDASLSGKKGELTAGIAAIKEKIGETKLQISKIKTSHRREILLELRQTQQKLAEAIQKEKAAKALLNRTMIRSPIDGTVVGMKIHTLGGVIRPGESVMDIVPSHEELIVEAEINPLDIDVVHPGLTAKVQLVSFNLRNTPMLFGKVTNVSADAFSDQNTGKSYYMAKIVIDQKELNKLKQGQALYPGMPVQVMIITAKLTPFQYFISPIRNSFNRAFREQ